MFLKLVKHELHETARMLLPVFGGLLLLSAMARAMIWVMEQNDHVVLVFMGTLFISLFVFACIACVILTAILMMVRFTKSVHGDEGYLTHTLPVGVHSILLSRLLITVLSLAAALGVTYLAIRLCTWNVKAMEDFNMIFTSGFEYLGLDSGFLWRVVASVFVSLVTTVLLIFAAISIGHSFNRGKVGFSILFYFAMNTIASVISTLLALVFSSSFLDSEAAELSTFSQQSFLLSLCINLIFCGVYYFLTWIMTKKRLNLS